MMRRLLLLPVLLALVALPSTVRADAFANAKVDWSTFKVDVFDVGFGTPTFSWVGGNGSVSGYAITRPNPPVPYGIGDFGSSPYGFSLVDGASTLKANSNATCDTNSGGVLLAHVDTSSGVSSSTLDNVAEATSYVDGSFTMDGSKGFAVITFDWILDAAGSEIGDFAVASVIAEANYWDGTTNGSSKLNESTWVFDSGSSTLSGTATLTISNMATGIATGLFSINASATSQSPNTVPEPASCILMGLGLGGIGFVGYRRRAAKNR